MQLFSTEDMILHIALQNKWGENKLGGQKSTHTHRKHTI